MRTISKNSDVTRQDDGEIGDGRIADLVALSGAKQDFSIFSSFFPHFFWFRV
jgi:hypothetical protein